MAQLDSSSADRARTGIANFERTTEASGGRSASPVPTASLQKTGDSKKSSRPSANRRRPSNGIQKRVRFDLISDDTSRSITHSNVSAQSKSRISPYAPSSSLTLQSNHASPQSRLGRCRRLLRRDAKTDDQRRNGSNRKCNAKGIEDFNSDIQGLNMENVKEGLKSIKVCKPNDWISP
ncbi:hypothetical protein N7478_010512 [Penicillium angulare]|uniref:uncharacterized protein n=1 Tax=Penicillium angulare TaxID=116970 RepID=UPI00253F70D8|nr:uncharacterized protein N7478_010512 [Penicillium angulare]KAJ5267704.1 hypothetical protein N7478_010512 [Penicillium angulare]